MTLPTPVELTAAGIGFGAIAGLVAWLLPGGARLAIYAGMAAALCFTAAGVAHTYKQQGVDAQKAEDAPVIKAANDRADTAAKAKDTALADLASLRGAYAVQDQHVAALGAALEQSEAETAAAKAKGDDAARKYETARLTFAEMIGVQSKPEEACANADRVLRALAGVVRNDAR
jgi:hypothetical protein